MIVKMNNRCEGFYEYLGKFFGSRVVEKQTNDRIYDDPNKDWYVYLKDERVMAFISIESNIIKNIYAIKNSYLEELLKTVKEENEIKGSIVTRIYQDLYEKCGYKVDESNGYKNFVVISTQNESEESELLLVYKRGNKK